MKSRLCKQRRATPDQASCPRLAPSPSLPQQPHSQRGSSHPNDVCPRPLSIRRTDGPKRHRLRSVVTRPPWMEVPRRDAAAGEWRAPSTAGNRKKIARRPGNRKGPAERPGEERGKAAKAAGKQRKAAAAGENRATANNRAKPANGCASRGKAGKQRRSAGCSTT